MSAAHDDEIDSSQARLALDAIARVPPQSLAEAISRKRMDPSSEEIRDVEWRSYIGRRRGLSGAELERSAAPDDLTGIALSGGGIRSATFALGVLQALAKHDLLRRFDYLSTVSGGGYIGASLTWLTSRTATEALATDKALAQEVPLPEDGFGLGPSGEDVTSKPFPFGSEDPSEAREPDQSNATGRMLRYLRQHGNYLTPGKGITLTSVIVVLLRGIVLNLLVWIPIFAGMMWLLIAASLHGLPAAVAEFVSPFSPHLKPGEESSQKLVAFGLMLAAAAVLFVLCVAAYIGYSLATYSKHGADGPWLWWLRSKKYAWRRVFERWMRIPLWLIGGLVLVASVPFAVRGLHGWVLGSSFSLIGLASGLLAFVRTMQPRKSKAEQEASWAIPSSWIASIGAAFLLYGVLAVSYAFAWWAQGGSPVLGLAPSWVLGGALVLALLTGWFVDLNLITVHRFYRDRLMEAFLPDVDKALLNETGPAEHADSAALSGMCDIGHAVGPYHLINTNLVLTESDERIYRLRGGDSFVLSPRYCGSNATGWQPTCEFVDNELTLPTAMAVSGAAANPWTASGGIGVTRNPLVGMLMALMNLRLGFWLPNPNTHARGRWRRSCTTSFRANHFDPGLKEVLGINLRENSPVCLLSDGGHFENLALYELIRRRLRLIVACDGGADPDYAFADLQNAMARIWADFGARIEFRTKTTLQHFMPSIEAIYPRDVRLSRRAYAIADITYADDSTGHLVYLTTALCHGLRLRLLGYKGANPDFPDQSTADQFFDEEQFEAYRELGYHIARGVASQICEILEQNSVPPAARGMLARSPLPEVQPHAAE